MHVYSFHLDNMTKLWMRMDDSATQAQLVDDECKSFLNSAETIDIYRWEVEQVTTTHNQPNHWDQTADIFYETCSQVCPQTTNKATKDVKKGRYQHRFNPLAQEATPEAVKKFQND